MKPDSKLLDDLARMAGGAAGLMSSVRQQMTDDAKDRIEAFIARMDLPTRKEIDHLQAQIKALRAEIEMLKPKKAKSAPAKTKPLKKSKGKK